MLSARPSRFRSSTPVPRYLLCARCCKFDGAWLSNPAKRSLSKLDAFASLVFLSYRHFSALSMLRYSVAVRQACKFSLSQFASCSFTLSQSLLFSTQIQTLKKGYTQANLEQCLEFSLYSLRCNFGFVSQSLTSGVSLECTAQANIMLAMLLPHVSPQLFPVSFQPSHLAAQKLGPKFCLCIGINTREGPGPYQDPHVIRLSHMLSLSPAPG